MPATIEGNELVIRLPLQKPTSSKSGKTLIVATTNGFEKTDAVIENKVVSISVNAIIYKGD